MCKADNLTQTLVNCIGEINTVWTEYNQKLSSIDMEQEDLLHEIELTRFNAYEGYIVAKKLQEVRQCRREIKDEEARLRCVRDLVSNSKVLDKLVKQLNSIDRKEEAIKSRFYTPRIRTDLKLIKLQKVQ